jgi:hypothetical protein
MVPDPDRESFGGRILQTLDLIEQIVVEPFHQGIDGASQIGKVDDPTERRIEWAAYRDGPSKRMAVDTSALVALFDMREKVCSFEVEVFDELYDFAHQCSLMPVAERRPGTLFPPWFSRRPQQSRLVDWREVAARPKGSGPAGHREPALSPDW